MLVMALLGRRVDNAMTGIDTWKIGDHAIIGPEVYHRWASREGPVVGIDGSYGSDLLIEFDPGFAPARVAATQSSSVSFPPGRALTSARHSSTYRAGHSIGR